MLAEAGSATEVDSYLRAIPRGRKPRWTRCLEPDARGIEKRVNLRLVTSEAAMPDQHPRRVTA
jgi:hypothetical protein